ncbi:MAG: prenyltransferase [Bacteroidales bacterium]|nr:prenyltransferase [Bacteroidales bacterium]
MSKLIYWIQNARAYALPQSVLPALVAVFMAVGNQNFSIGLSIVAVLGVMLAHLSVNLFDDYFDYQFHSEDVREQTVAEGHRARIAKSPYLTSGEVTTRELFIVASLFGLAALLLGCIVFVTRGLTPLYIALAAGFLGFFYSGKPIRFCYHGLGELVTGLIFGPLLMIGVHYSACGTLNTGIYVVSIAVGLWVVNILYTHSIMDATADHKVGKKTLSEVLKIRPLQLTASAVFNFTPYIILLISLINGSLHPVFATIFLILPLSITLFYLICQFCYHPEREYARKWWYGPIEHWDVISENHLEWFAIRWFLARNILQFASIIFIICSLLF